MNWRDGYSDRQLPFSIGEPISCVMNYVIITMMYDHNM